VRVLDRLVERGDTLGIVEHHPFIANADGMVPRPAALRRARHGHVGRAHGRRAREDVRQTPSLKGG
jgi:hypothetical protein